MNSRTPWRVKVALGNQKWQLHNSLFRGRCNHPPIIPAKLQSIPLVSNRNPFSAFALQSNEFERGSMEGSGGHSLAPTGCSKQNAPEQPSPGHDAHRAQSNARVEREGATRAEETLPPHIPAVRIWGPVPKDQAVGLVALALYRSTSVVATSLRPFWS